MANCVNQKFSGNSQAWSGASTGATIVGTVGTIFGPVGTAVGSLVGSLVGGLFSGNSEDTSAAGWMNYANSNFCKEGFRVPTKAEVLANQSKLTGKAKQFAASYKEPEGYFRDGDWMGQITELSPVRVKWFKGAGESFMDAPSSWYYVPQNPVLPASVSSQQPITQPSIKEVSNLIQSASQKAFTSSTANKPVNVPLIASIAIGVLFVLVVVFNLIRKK